MNKIEKNEKKFLSNSQKLFDKVYPHVVKKVREKPNTIFENLDYISKDDLYLKFIDSNFYDKVITENSDYKKMQIITDYIYEEFSNIFYEVKANLEANSNNLTFQQQFLLENTLDNIPEIVRYHKSISPTLFEEMMIINRNDKKYNEYFESGLLYGTATGAGAIALGGTPLVALGVGTATALAIELFMPTKWSLTMDKHIVGFATFLGRLLLGTKSLISIIVPGLNISQKIHEEFDNIELNKDFSKLFERIGSRNTFNNGDGAQSLNVIIQKCIDNNRDLFDDKNFLTTPIQNINIYRNILNSMILSNGNKNNFNGQMHDKLLAFRKCIISSLADVYKFITIANLKDVSNYKHILDTMDNGFNVNPTQLLNFIEIKNDHPDLVKENLLDLIKFRMLINEMIKLFKQGSFDVDREAGNFMEQKFKIIDREIAEYLKSNRNKIDAKHEFEKIPPKQISPFNKRYNSIINNGNKENTSELTPGYNGSNGSNEGDEDNETKKSDEIPSRLNF